MPVDVDVVIFGGGAAGLWLLDDLHRTGFRALLLEAHALGAGQTIVSQGIIHGGLKYTLRGLLTSSARSIREMPLVWRRCLAGEHEPHLSAVRLRSEFCHLWQTTSMRSRAGMIGARAGLLAAPRVVTGPERPDALRSAPGTVARVDEQVIEPDSFVQVLAQRHRDRILRIDVASGLEFVRSGNHVDLVRLIAPETGAPLDLRPGSCVLTAGAGNAGLRERLGLDPARMQRRPLHMVIARCKSLPAINGHCVDGMHTRATITTTRDLADRTIWQIGGQIAEDGVRSDPAELCRSARRELEAILPGIDLSQAEWMAYRVDRAELAARDSRRPADVGVLQEGNVITAWPTKLALAPRLAARIGELLGRPDESESEPWHLPIIRSWSSPSVAVLPWEEPQPWIIDP